MSDVPKWRPVTVRLGDLRPWERNPRRIGKRAAARLLKSWQEMGQVQTVAVGPNGEVYDGHQRLSVLLEVYGPEYPVHALQSDRPLTDEERARLTILLHAGAVGDWDWDALTSWDPDLLADAGMDRRLAEILSADAHNLRKLLTALNVVPGGDNAPDINVADELREKWGTAPGQVWRAGRHRLMVGDSTDPADIARLLDGAEPYLMVTDPPYGVEYDPTWRQELGLRSSQRLGKVHNDNRSDWSDVYAAFPAKVLYSWSPSGPDIIRTGTAILAAGFEIRAQIIWVKPHLPIARGHYSYKHEPCWYAVRKGANARWIGPPKTGTVWEFPLDPNVLGGHSTQKPVEAMARPIRHHEGDVVDPFLGSGTTVVAAEQEGRVCYGMEIDPSYMAVTLQRLADLGMDVERIE